jgi:Glycosyl transferase family 2
MTLAPLPPVAIASCMRNEGIHLLEWLAYHRVIGFGLPVICTNDCEDGSDHLLDCLMEAGAVTHLRNTLGPEDRPIHAGIALALAHLREGPAEWLAHLDSDEFLNIGPGAAPVQDLIARVGTAHAVALPWLSFGDSGHAEWPGETLRAFTACEAAIDPDRVKFKSLFRIRAFAGASDHMPTRPLVLDPIASNSAGETLSNAQLLGAPRSRYHPVSLAMRGGTVVNHYAIRSRDVFLLKNLRGRGTGPASNKYHLNSLWHRRANRNERQDRSILTRWPEVAAELIRLRALPGVDRAEAACRDWFLATRSRTLTDATLARWTAKARR